MYGHVLQMCYVSLQYFIIKGAIPSLKLQITHTVMLLWFE